MNDLDLIERLRAAGAQGPASRHTPDAVLAAGRRAQARRNVLRISGATLSLAAVVVAGMQLTPGSGTQLVTAAGDGAPGDAPAPAVKPVPHSAAELDDNSDRVNAAILQAAMGDDFEVAREVPAGKLRPGTESAADLPAIYSGSVSLSTMVSNAAGLKAMCAPLVEKGATFDGCVTHTMPDGRDVQVNFSRWAPTAAYPQDTAGEAVRVFFLQPNGVLAWTDLTASAAADDSTESSGAAAQKWLGSLVDRLGTAAADPDLEPQGFDGDHCDLTDGTWNCDPSDTKPAPSDEKAVEAKKAAAAQAEQMDAKKAAAAKAAASEPDPANEKAIAEKKAAAAEAEQMDAKKAAAAKECAAAGTC